MVALDDYVARTEGTCGEDKDIIVLFKYDRKDEAVKKIFAKAKTEKTVGRVIFEMTFQGRSFRVYPSGKAIFRSIKTKDELNRILSELLL